MFEIDFFNNENMTLFWEYVKSLLTTISPALMIFAAVSALGIFIPMLIKAFRGASEDDDDFEYKEF